MTATAREQANGAEVANGDYVALVERLSGAAPGRVLKAKKQPPVPPNDVMPWFMALSRAAVLGLLSYIALGEQVVTLAGRRGEHSYFGSTAVAIGFVLLAGAMVAVMGPIRSRRAIGILGTLLLSAWLTTFILYFTR